jgi:hypothetical protein
MWLSRVSGSGRAVRRAGGLAVALLCVAGACGSPARAAAPAVTVVGDSVLVAGSSFGDTTLRVTRPDALTGAPVVIGQYEGLASPSAPFSVNTTVPTPLRPNGDCWQKGALASALTPDLRPGDTVTLTQAGLVGSASSSTSVAVTAEAVEGATGPIPACRQIAPWARNAVTGRPDRVAGGPMALSGVAQPFARRVSVSANDGATATAPVAATPAQDGTWSATIPAGEVRRLASGTVTVNPVFEVPDVSTGAAAHITGAGAELSKSHSANGPGGGNNGGGVRVRSLRGPARISLGSARRNGIRASFVVPADARVVRVQLDRGRRALVRRDVPAGTSGTRQIVRLRGPRLRRVLHRGRFRLAVRAGTSRSQLGPPVTRAIVID